VDPQIVQVTNSELNNDNVFVIENEFYDEKNSGRTQKQGKNTTY
jgi:hypothetical protein